jgi:alpha-tubulin suppressor-like RCC1 family protein
LAHTRQHRGSSFRFARLLAFVSCLSTLGVAAFAASLDTDQVIVRVRGPGVPAAEVANARGQSLAARISSGSEPVTHRRVTGDGSHVMKLFRRLPTAAIEAMSHRFVNDADIVEILPDRIAFPALSPNDPQFAQQWPLWSTNGINAPAAWDITTGSPNLIIGIVDTGRIDHADLAGRWIGGYDFIDDANRSSDGDGRDANAADTGDWVTAGEAASGPLAGCPVTASRWHGTAMAGVIGATGNNAVGIAGLNWNSKLLPVRVVGKCGGYTSDIVDGLRWAAGIPVPGIPNNANTADVVNVSLATVGGCDPAWQSAINELTNLSIPVIVAAGNNAANAATYSPANCIGVITVGAVDRNGRLPSYANSGAAIALSAPGGVGNAADAVRTTFDSGTTVPLNDSIYTSVNGTSIATAHVTGIASLMLSSNPTLLPHQVKSILRLTAKAFPTSEVAGEINCNDSLCGNGIVDAERSVQAARAFGSGPPTPMVAVGPFGISLGLRSDGTVFEWIVGAQGGYTGAALTQQNVDLSDVRRVAISGEQVEFALRQDGTLWTWGRNPTNTYSVSLPIRVAGLSSLTSVAAGANFWLALKGDGTVWGAGTNTNAQLGDGTLTTREAPVQAAGLVNAVAIAAGSVHGLALRGDGTVWAWGNNSSGQLGQGALSSPQPTPVQVGGLTNVVAVAASAGGAYSLALRSDGTVWAWGENSFGQLGTGPTTQLAPVQIAGLANVSAIAAGYDFALALKTDGTVWGWGHNAQGQLADGTTINRTSPVQVLGLAGIVAIAAGNLHSIAIKDDGNVYAWGADIYQSTVLPPTVIPGAEGLGTLSLIVQGLRPNPFAFLPVFGAPLATPLVSNPVTISGLGNGVSSPITVAGGEISLNGGPFASTPGFVTNGDVVRTRVTSASGFESLASSMVTIGGAVGSFSTFNAYTLRDPSLPKANPAIALGDSHGILLNAQGNVLAFGYNGNGQLGNGSTFSTPVPTPVSGVAGVTRIASGANHALALRSDGTLVAWGYNLAGQLGDGTQVTRPNAVAVSGPGFVSAISAGRYHSLALKADGTAWAWGLNVEGQVGDNSNVSTRLAPVQVTGLAGVVAIAAGGRHNLALLSNGNVLAWGSNDSGQLGDGTTTLKRSPVLAAISGVIAIAAGESHSLAIKNDGTVWAWGANGFGQLGDGTTTNRLLPVAVASLGSGVGLIACGEKHSLAVKAGGAMYAWGNNTNSQLGNGANANSPLPVALTAPTAVVSISGGARHSAAIDANRKLYVWGDNFFGQVGNKSGNYSPQSGSLNVLRGDSKISEGTSASSGGVGTGSNSGSSVLEIDGQATSFDFGAISAGSAKTTSGRYANQSPTDDITGLSLSVTGSGFGLQSHDCPSTLGPNQECGFTLAFTPSSSALYAGELQVTSNVVGSPERRSLSGAGVATAAISFAKNGVSFPPQPVGTSTAAVNLALTNTGNATLNISSVASSLPDYTTTHNCASVAPGASCALAITFTPTAVNGRGAYLTIASNGSGAPHTVTLDGTGVASSGTPIPGLTGVVSKKSHAIAGSFDVAIDASQALAGLVTVEPRASGSHVIVFQFNTAITSPGTASVTPSGAVSAVINGSTVEVTVTGVVDNKRVTVSLANVNNAGGSVAASVGFLVGDGDGNRTVNATDIFAIKALSGLSTAADNFRHDLNLSGAITAADILAAKGRLGLTLP